MLFIEGHDGGSIRFVLLIRAGLIAILLLAVLSFIRSACFHSGYLRVFYTHRCSDLDLNFQPWLLQAVALGRRIGGDRGRPLGAKEKDTDETTSDWPLSHPRIPP